MTEFLCVVYIHSLIKEDCRYSSGSDESRLAIQWHIRSEHSQYFNRDLYGPSSMDFPVVEFKEAPLHSFTGPQSSLGDSLLYILKMYIASLLTETTDKQSLLRLQCI